MKGTYHTVGLYFSICLLLFIAIQNIMAEDDKMPLEQIVRLSSTKGTVYKFIKEISDQSGYLFVYDSRIIDNDQKIKIKKGDYPLTEAIYTITGNDNIRIDILDKYILLRLPEETGLASSEKETLELKVQDHFVIRGNMLDQIDGKPIVYGSIQVVGTSLGTVSNHDGGFQLVLPDSLRANKIQLSHIGYESLEIEPVLLEGQDINFFLEPKAVSLEEVVIKPVDPVKVMNYILEKRKENYFSQPVLLTSFYREGITYKNQNIDITEAVLQVFKSSYYYDFNQDQARLIKKRRIVDSQKSDTILPKLKAGINTCFVLDIMKELPDFIDLSNNDNLYTYKHETINFIDDRKINVISFEQKKGITEPLYKGTLFVESENGALREAHFELNPQFVHKATNLFLDKKGPKLAITLEQAKYIVSYKQSAFGQYYISHIRGDVIFKVRRKKRLFSNPLHFWFEMVSCKMDTDGVKNFSKKERVPSTKIFAETKHIYDKDFWGDFNIILPEEQLKETIINNLNEVILNIE